MNPVSGAAERSGPDARDPGLQPERTSLSWRRTLLALVVTDLFLWRAWALSALNQDPNRSAGIWGLGLAATVATVATILICACVFRRGRQLLSGNDSASAALLKTATAAVVLLAVAVVTVIVLTK